MTPEPGSWLDPDPRYVELPPADPQLMGTEYRAGLSRRRSVVVPLVLVAAVVAGLIVFVVTR